MKKLLIYTFIPLHSHVHSLAVNFVTWVRHFISGHAR